MKIRQLLATTLKKRPDHLNGGSGLLRRRAFFPLLLPAIVTGFSDNLPVGVADFLSP